MLKARMIRPEFWTDERVISLSAPGRLLFIACWQLADDHGRFEWEPGRIKWQVFPADAFDVEAMGAELDAIGLIQIYTGDGRRFVSIPNFSKHQKLHKGRDSNFPTPPQIGPDRPTSAQTGPKPNLTKPNLSELNTEGPKAARVRFKPPSIEEVIAYASERGFTNQAERFHDYYTGNGWRVGKNPMKDWQAAFRNWEKNSREFERGGKVPRLASPEEMRNRTEKDWA